MNYSKIPTFIFLIISVSLCSCLNFKNPANKVEYYTLEYDPPVINGMDPIPYVIRINRFTVAPSYNTTKIIYRPRSYQRDAYAYHKWNVNPGDLVTHFLVRDIRQSGLFKATLFSDSKLVSSIAMEGALDEFFELDSDEVWKAVLSLNIVLLAENEPDVSKRIIMQKAYHATEDCKRKNPGALAEAISIAMSRISGEIIKDIYKSLSEMK